MSRLIFVPAYPVPMRYQEFFIYQMCIELSRKFSPIETLLPDDFSIIRDYQTSNFAPIESSIYFELDQMKKYVEVELRESDTLLHMDLSFPGLFHNLLYHKRPKKCFAYCHGSSLNKMDYFEKDRASKWLVEFGNSKIYDKIFVASNYHKEKLGMDNIEVIGLPIPPFSTYKLEKRYNIISVARPNPQKIDLELERKVSSKFGPITRKECKTWEEYYEFLSEGKIVLFSGFEETFGYPVMEAIMNNSIPICPNRCSYPELLDDSYLYHNTKDLLELIDNYLSNYNLVPELKCLDLCQNFYSNLISHMSS